MNDSTLRRIVSGAVGMVALGLCGPFLMADDRPIYGWVTECRTISNAPKNVGQSCVAVRKRVGSESHSHEAEVKKKKVVQRVLMNAANSGGGGGGSSGGGTGASVTCPKRNTGAGGCNS